MKEIITLRNGNTVEGRLVHTYSAFEGGMRYIFVTEVAGEIRCIKDADGNYVEYTP